MKAITRIFMVMLTGIISALGFTACSGDAPDMYGTPMAKFQVKGTVKDENGHPVQNAKVVLTAHAPYNNSINDTITVSADGKYDKELGVVLPSPTSRLICFDTDDAYERDTVYVDINLKEGGGWDLGTAKIDHNFILKKK